MNSSPINPLLSTGAATASPQSWPVINAEVISSQPLTQLQQNYLNQLLASTGARTQNALLNAMGATSNTNATPTSPLPGPTAELQLTRLLIADQPRWLLTDKPPAPGSQLQLQVTPRGLIPVSQASPPATSPRTATQAQAQASPGPASTVAPAPQLPPKALSGLIERWLANSVHVQPESQPLKQLAVSQLLRAAISLAKPTEASAQSLKLSPAIAQSPLIARALEHTQLSSPATASQVKLAIEQSGLFAEANLRRALDTAPDPVAAAAKPDTKLLLWGLLALTSKTAGSDLLQKLLNLLQLPTEFTLDPKQLPPLKAQIQGWLANITRQQLQLLSQTQLDGTDNPRLQLELPVKSDQHSLPVFLTIEKHWRRPEEEPEPGQHRRKAERIAEWSFSLSIDIPHQGPLDVRLRSNGTQLSCTLWTDQPELERHINHRLDKLARALQDDGIQLSQIRCLAGRMPTTGPALNSSPLLDTHA